MKKSAIKNILCSKVVPELSIIYPLSLKNESELGLKTSTNPLR